MPVNPTNADQEEEPKTPEYVAPHSAVNYSGKLGQFSGYAVNQNDPNSPKYTITGNAPDFQSMLNLYGAMNDDRRQPIRMLMPENYDRFNQLPQSVRAWNIDRGYSQGYSNYWEDPLKVGRYYTALKTLPEGTPLPSWLDKNGIESAYKYFEAKYPGQQWTSWKPLPEGDPGIDYLRTLKIPPLTAMNPGDIKPVPVPDNDGWYTMNKETAAQSFPEEYLKNVPQDNLGNYIFDQKTLDAWTAGENVAGIPKPIYDKMDWKSQLGVQALQYAMPVGMFGLMGGLVLGGIPGALIGAGFGVGIVELAKHWEAAQNAMLKMNIPAEEVEKIFGLWNQFKYSVKDPEAYGKVSEVLGDIKTAYEAGAVYYNAAVGPSKTGNPLDIYKQYYGMGTNKTRVTRIDYESNDKGGYDLVVKREEDLIAPDGKAITGWALHEARTRIAAGENADDVVAEIQGKFGLEGDVRELVGQMVLDPLNLVDLGANKLFAQAAKASKRMNVYKAFNSTNDIIDAVREYGRLVRFEPKQQAAAHGKFARWLAGVDETGKMVEPGKGMLKALRGLTPQARAHELLQHTQDGLKIILTQAKGSPETMVAIYNAISGDNPIDAAKKLQDAQFADFTMPKWFDATEAQAVPVAYRAAKKAVEELYDSWNITRPQAQVIDQMAKIMSDAGYITNKNAANLPYQLIKKLGDMKTNADADAWFAQFKADLVKNAGADPNIKALLDQINGNDVLKNMTGSDLKKMTDLFYGKSPLPYGPDHFAALMIQDVSKSIDEFAANYFKVKPHNNYKKMIKVVKTAQGIVLLGISPSYFLNNMINNYVTLGWDGLLSLSSHKGRMGYFKRLGYIPERLREGFNAAEIGDVNSGIANDLYAMDSYQAGDQIRKAVKGEGKTGTLGKFLDAADEFLHKGDKWQIAAVLSTLAERQASEMAVYKAMREFLDNNHVEGKGYSKMPDEVYLALEALQPGLGKKIKNAIRRGLSRSEIEKQVFQDWKKRSIFDVLTPEEKATVTAHFPDVFDELDETIRNAKTDTDVTDAVSKARNKLQEEVSREVMRRMEEIVQGTENTVRIEGGQAIIDEANKMIMDMGNFWMEHFRYADQIAEEAHKYIGNSKRRQAIWTRYNIVSDRNWNLFNNIHGAKWLGIHRGIGGAEAYRLAEDLLIQQHDNWGNFFSTKKRLMNDFFDMSGNLQKADSQLLWEQTNKQINDLYKNSLVEEDLLQTRLDEIFTSEYAKQFGIPDEAAAWVKAVHDVRQQMAHAMYYYRSGGDTIAQFAPLDQAVMTRIDNMLNGDIPYKMSVDLRDKVMKRFMTEVYVPYIRKIMDASNSTAPGSGMPQAPITPNTPGSSAPAQAAMPYDTTPPTPSEMTPRDAEVLLGMEEADVRRLEQIADIELPEGRLFESTTEALDRYQAGDRLYQQMHSWQTGLPNLRSYYMDYAARITAGADHTTGYLAHRGMETIPGDIRFDYYRAIADILVERGYQVYDNFNGEFAILFPSNFTPEMAQDAMRGIVNDLDNAIIKIGDQSYVGQRYYSGIGGTNARAETIANATADQYIRTHSGIDDRAVKQVEGDTSTQGVDTSAQEGTGSGTSQAAEQASDQVIDAADAIENRTEPARGQPDEPLEFKTKQDIEDFAKGMEDTDSVLVSETTGEVVDAATLRARATEIRKFIAEEYGNQEFGEGKSFNDRHLINTFNQYGYKVDNLGQVTQDMARDVLDRRKAAREQFMPREVEAEMLKRSQEINQQRALEMESAVRRYALQSPKAMTREAFRLDMVDILGNTQQADAILEITDRLADYWTKHNRTARMHKLTTDDWYKTFILQKSGEGDVRGMTRYMDDGRAIIQAFSKADISTVLHELGHVFIRQLDDVEINELNKALFGKDVGVDWARMDDATTRPYQEAFAKAFERYFHDGIAPNKKLIPVFERIKTWIMDVYQSITKLDVKVSPETRKIFDRWLGGPDADDATKVVDIPPAPELSGTEVIAPMARRPEYKVFLDDVNATKPDLKKFMDDAKKVLPDIPEGTLTDLHRTLVEQWIKEGSALGDEVLDDYPELARAVQPVEVEGNIWDAFRRKEKQTAKQMGMFAQGEDTPLFSGTPQNVAEETFTPDPVSPQQALFDRGEFLPEMEAKVDQGGELEGPLFKQVDAPGMTRNDFIDKVHNLFHKGNQKETNRVMAVLDGMAEYWSRRSNKPADQWWVENVADVVSGKDYLDNVLKQQAEAMINTPEFKKWFGKSKVVDKSGKPLVMYHGTGVKDLQVFDPNRAGTIQYSDWGKGTYFTPVEWIANEYRTEALKRTDQLGKKLYSEYEAKAKELGTRPMYESIDLGFGSEKYKELSEYFNKYIARLNEINGSKDGDVVNAYLKIENPLYHTYSGITDPYLSETAKANGHDGIIIKNSDGMVEEVVVFSPTQIKSIFNQGTFDPNNPNILYQRNIPDKWYYSQARRAVEQLPQERMTVGQLQGQLKKVGVKADEMYWGGLDDFLEGKNPNDKITKAEVLDYLEKNQVNVEEVMYDSTAKQRMDDIQIKIDELDESISNIGKELGQEADNAGISVEEQKSNDWETVLRSRLPDTSTLDIYNSKYAEMTALQDEYASLANEKLTRPQTKYSTYTTPGGENYRELLLTLPIPEQPANGYRLTIDNSPIFDTVDEANKWAIDNGYDPTGNNFDARVNILPVNEKSISPELYGTYTSQHWQEPNVLAHIRFDDRVDIHGKKVLFLEEIQSDWHQAGREKGYKRTLDTSQITAKYIPAEPGQDPNIYPGYWESFNEYGEMITRHAGRMSESEVLEEAKLFANLPDKRVPPAPFSKNWEELAMKRMIRYAAENGYDRIAWTPGKVQADRYNLAKQVDHITTYRNEDGTYRVTAISKDRSYAVIDEVYPAQKLPDVIGKELADKTVSAENDMNVWQDDDLVVGGEGMKAFYDQKLPNIANKYIKKWGGKVGEATIDNGIEYLPRQMGTGDGPPPTKQLTFDVPAFDITPEMKESVMGGQALFQNAKGAVSWADNSKALIHAMEAGDFTTTLHESGHIFLKSLVGVADDDLAEVTKWLNDEYKLNLKNDWILEPVQTHEAAHEAFIRGFERYLQEGRAPIPRLQKVFEDLKAWMTEIYNKVRGLEGVKLNDDIRRVFDKWVSGGNNITSLDEGRISQIISSRKNLDQYLKEIGIDPTVEDFEVQAFGILEGMHNKLLRDRRTADLATNIKNAAEVDAQFAKAKYKLFKKDPVESNTPFQVAEVATYLADIQPGDRVFEPYAGTGNMIEPIRLVDGVQITANDFDPAMQNVLTDLGYTRVTGQDMQTTRPGRSYNKIITAPPSGPGTTQYKMPIATEDVSQAYIHAALEHLADGGRLVAVVPMNWASRLDPDTLLIDTYITPYLQYLQDRYQTAFIEIPQESWNGRAIGGRHAILVVDNIPPKGTPVAHIDDLAPNTMDDLAKLVEDIKKTQVIPDEDKLVAKNIAYMKPEDMPQMSDTRGLAQPMGYGTRETFAYMGTNKINMIKKVVDLYDLIPSHLINFQANPKYPAELQPRLSRGGFAGKEQVLDIAKNLDPDKLLDDTRGIDDFCPIVRADNVVVSGNGRAMSMVYAAEYHPGNIQKYIERLREVLPDHGLSEAELAGKKIPVLVREITDDIDLKKFAQTANMPAGMTLNDIEIIKISKDYVDLQDFSLLQIGDWQSVEGALRNSVNAEVIGKFIERLPQDMRNQFIDNDGLLSHKGANYLQSAILFRVYGNEQGQKLAAAFINYDSAGIKNMQTAMMESLGMLLKAEALVEKGLRDPELSIANDIAIVVDKYAQLLAQKDVSVGAYLATNTLFDDGLTPLQKSLLGYFDKYSRSRKELREFIIAYAEKVIEQNPPEQMSFTPPPTKAEILSGIAKNFDFNETEELAKVRSQNANETMSRIQAEAGEGDVFKKIESPEGFEAPEQMPAQPAPQQIPGQGAPQPVTRQPRTTRRRQPRQPASPPQEMPAMGAPLGSGDGLTQMPIVESEVETWLRNIMPLLDKLETGLTGTNVPIDQTIQNLDQVVPAPVMKKLKAYLGQVYADTADELIAATRYAEGMRDYSLHNYGRKYELDEYAQGLYPYHFWYTRSMVNWMLRGMTRPSYWSNYVRMKEFIDKYTMKDGFPARLKGKVAVPFPWLPDFAGDSLYIDPMKVLFPHEQLIRPFERLASDNNIVEKKAMQVLADMYEEGQISEAEHTLAKSKQGPDWATAVLKARQDADLEVNNAFDFASLISSPSLPLSYAYYLQSGQQDKINQLPITKTIMHTSKLLGMGGDYGINIEEGWRKKNNMPLIDRWEDYRVDVMMANMVAEGLYTLEDMKMATMERSGPLYEEAVRRSSMVGTMRFFGAALGLDIFPEGEQLGRQLTDDYYKAIEEKKQGNKNAVNEFLEKHPEYAARQFALDDPDRRARYFLINGIWDKYMNMNSLEKNAVRDQFGNLFQDAFLDKNTRSYNAIDDETLTFWARTLGSTVPSTAPTTPTGNLKMPSQEEMQKYNEKNRYYDEREKQFPGIGAKLQWYYAGEGNRMPDPEIEAYNKWNTQFLAENPHIIPEVIGETNELSGVPNDVQAYVYQYRALRDQMYPNIFDIQDEYYQIGDSKKRKEYLKTNPMLPAYWNWRRVYASQYTKAAPYILSEESLAQDIAGDAYDIINFDPSNISPLITKELIRSEMYGQPIDSHVMEAITNEWEASGKIGGDLQTFIYGYLLPSLQMPTP